MGFDNVNVNVSGGQSIIKALQNYNTVILKPNIVDNRNVLTQEMMSERHTKYVIRWNYSLEGATINVPQDCIIEFAGGTIDNGTIVGNNTLLMYSKPIDEVCPAERQGTFIYNTTVADEEDITSTSGQLKFKDRPATDGMGRKILRKNIVNGVNTLTQSMIQTTNTIYIIQYDFTLGEDITIPTNCVLEFDGGSVSAGTGENKDTITGNNTGIKAELVKIFNTDVILAGTWNIVESYPEWFGAKGDGTTDDTTAFESILASVFDKIVLTNNYKFGSTLTFGVDKKLYFLKGSSFIPASGITIHIKSYFEAGNYEIFDYTSGGYIDKFYSKTEYNISHFSGHSFTEKWNNLRHDLVQNREYTLYVPEPQIGMDGIIVEYNGTIYDNPYTAPDYAYKNWKIDGPIYFNDPENHATWRGYCTFMVVGNLDAAFIFGNQTKPENINFVDGLSVGNSSIGTCNVFLDFYSVTRLFIPRLYMSSGKIGARFHNRTVGEGVGSTYIDYLYSDSMSEKIVIFEGSRYYTTGNIKIGHIEAQICSNDCIPVSFKGRVHDVTIGSITQTSLNFAEETKLRTIVLFDQGIEYAPRCISIGKININGSLIQDESNPSAVVRCIKSDDEMNALATDIYIGSILDIAKSGFYGCIVDYCGTNFTVENLASDFKVRVGVSAIGFRLLNYSGTSLTDNGGRYNTYGLSVYDASMGNLSIVNRVPLGGLIRFSNKVVLMRIGNSGVVADDFIRLSTTCQYQAGSSFPAFGALTNDQKGNIFYRTDFNRPTFLHGVDSTQNTFRDADGFHADRKYGTSDQRPKEWRAGGPLDTTDIGYRYYDKTLNKWLTLTGFTGSGIGIWAEDDGAKAGVSRSGTFANKPAATDIYVGFRYFCTDKQTTEGATDGIEIIHKGSNVWVDALGRVVS